MSNPLSSPTSDAMDDVPLTNRHSGEALAINTHASTALEVFCLVLGETAPFRVNIAGNESIGDLKEAIYNEKKNLAFTDANLFTLYLLNLPEDDGLLDTVDDMWLNPKSRLRVTKRLSQVFPAVLKDDTVHILVQPPN